MASSYPLHIRAQLIGNSVKFILISKKIQFARLYLMNNFTSEIFPYQLIKLQYKNMIVLVSLIITRTYLFELLYNLIRLQKLTITMFTIIYNVI